MDVIVSSQNSLIKEITALKEKKHRELRGLYFIEGLRFFEEALKENADILKVVISESFFSSEDKRINSIKGRLAGFYTVVAADRLYKTLSDTENPQGILAVIKQSKSSFDKLPEIGNRLIILEQLQDPGNMGTIIRTADAAGFNGIILSKGSVDPYNPKVLRSTMGSIFRMPLYEYSDTEAAFWHIRSKGTKILAAHLDGRVSCFETDIKDNIAFIIGNEASGVSKEAAALADWLITIPMAGRTESLNASVAATVLMYESYRQRLARV